MKRYTTDATPRNKGGIRKIPRQPQYSPTHPPNSHIATLAHPTVDRRTPVANPLLSRGHQWVIKLIPEDQPIDCTIPFIPQGKAKPPTVLAKLQTQLKKRLSKPPVVPKILLPNRSASLPHRR